ncbi:hypothetical protein B7P43_G09487 [Cryptotermes secundus]|uniref:Uncharacterized protein n=1 Tax=Cryptotermes secundus TaxID=105785 RepID=A0A2J7PXB6_9NEOP|nr:hypothetical protein B7P43_G09487 [Cryptotermes secundus]
MRVTSFVDARSGGSLASAEYDSKRLNIVSLHSLIRWYLSTSYLKLLVFEPLKTQW